MTPESGALSGFLEDSMASNKELAAQAADLAGELGLEKPKTEGLNHQSLTDLVAQLTAKKEASDKEKAEADAKAKADEDAKAKAQKDADARSEAERKKAEADAKAKRAGAQAEAPKKRRGPQYTVADGKSLTSPRGILAKDSNEGNVVRAGDYAPEQLARLVELGYITKNW